MPYLHCPQCRLTLYKPRAATGPAEACPRCGTRLSRRPRRLFGSSSVNSVPESVTTPGPTPPAAG